MTKLNLFTKNVSTRGRLIFIQIACVSQQNKRHLHAEHLFNSNQKEMPMNCLVTYFRFLFKNVFIHLSRWVSTFLFNILVTNENISLSGRYCCILIL